MSHGTEKYIELRYMMTPAQKLGGKWIQSQVVRSLHHPGGNKSTNFKWALRSQSACCNP